MMLGRTRRTSNPGKVRRGALVRRRLALAEFGQNDLSSPPMLRRELRAVAVTPITLNYR